VAGKLLFRERQGRECLELRARLRASRWLANCYLASRSACNIVHSVAGLARIELVVAEFKGIRAG
jgi:hypothetical protein